MLLGGCAVPDPSGTLETAPCPAYKWAPRRIHNVSSCNKPCVELSDVDEELTSDVMLDIALQNNPQTQQSWRIARAAAFNYGAAQSSLYPTIVGSETLNASNVWGAGSFGGGAVTTSNVSGVTAAGGFVGTGRFHGHHQFANTDLTATYLLFDFGGRQAQIAAACQALMAANWTHNRTIQNVMIAVLTAYYNHLNAIGIASAREQDLKDAEKSLEAAKQRFESGVGTRLDVLQAQTTYVNAELQLETALGQVKTTLGQLATAMGWPADTQFEVADVPEELPTDVITEDVSFLVEAAKAERPDVAAAYAAYLQAREAITTAESASLPTLSLGGDFQRTDVLHDPNLRGSSQTGTLNLNVPIFAGWLYENQIASARESAAAAYEAWKNAQNNAMQDVVNGYYAYTTAVEAIAYSQEYLKYAQEAFDAALLGYQVGTSTILDVLTAQSTLSSARSQWIQSRMQYLTSIATVAYAVGTL